ncbi:flagellar basal body rod modification protein [Helicobacter sp. MIT 00-7814]|nr:flagellar basal body rod modification protein [Helicobacter sp. MIT 99-10781]RDU55327.1 flagellar basal body rod modification protein [Helicobacter sp. MIT 00-7814]
MAIDLAEVTGATAKIEKQKQNPKNINELDNDAFMRLFLEQLKNQDPTAPMETDKIITQTAQLTQVEMQEQNKKTMVEVAEAMKSTQETNKELKEFQAKMKESLESLNEGMKTTASSNAAMAGLNALNSVSMIGKIAETDVFGINLSAGESVKFQIYFDEAIDTSRGDSKVSIFNQQNELVKTISLKNFEGKKGYVEFEWNGIDENGKQLESGSYNVRAEYNLDPKTSQYHLARVGRGEVQSIIFDKGAPMLRMGDMILPMQSAIEFYNKDHGL